MIQKEAVRNALIISDDAALSASLLSILKDAGYDDIDLSAASGTALPELRSLVIADSHLPGDAAMKRALDLYDPMTADLMILVDSSLYLQYREAVAGQDVYLLPKPLSPSIVSVALDWIASAREKAARFRSDKASVEETIDELRLVNRAKWLLITELKMDEPHAHRYIEKQAMDRSITKREVAAEIIRTYS